MFRTTCYRKYKCFSNGNSRVIRTPYLPIMNAARHLTGNGQLQVHYGVVVLYSITLIQTNIDAATEASDFTLV